MAIKVRQIWVDEKGEELPDTENRLYDVPCHNCGPMPCVGRMGGVFLCLGCIDEQEEERTDTLAAHMARDARLDDLPEIAAATRDDNEGDG